MIQGTYIEFEDIVPFHSGRDSVYTIDKEDINAIDQEIKKLLSQKVIVQSNLEEGEFVSEIFTKKKQDNSLRLILNLKSLNKNVHYEKFKMETFKAALALISPLCYMASVDMASAYYHVPIAESHWKFLKFIWKGQRYSFTCYPNGLSQAPRNFTKILKPSYAYLHGLNHIITGYLDDSLLIGMTKEECEKNILDTVNLLDSLGFTIHTEKSVLQPVQRIKYLGFIVDSESMSVSLTQERKDKIKDMCEKVMRKEKNKIRKIAALIGTFVSTFPAMEHGPLYYRNLEEDKKRALKMHRGQWDQKMRLSPASKIEIGWWNSHIHNATSPISHGEPQLIITSDASLIGWGAFCNGVKTGGAWTAQELTYYHINELELLGAFFALKSFTKSVEDIHVRLFLDNTSAVSCINKMGSSKSGKLNSIGKELWMWCIDRHIWLSAAHIPGKQNIVADSESRHINVDTEWMLNKALLTDSLKILHSVPTIDLFASRINFQMKRYISYKPDPDAFAIDAFSINWGKECFLAFPPFSHYQDSSKIMAGKATGIVIAPFWPTQTFYPVLMRMLINNPVLLSARQNLLHLPSDPCRVHPLHKKMRLLVCKVSGLPTETEAFLNQQPNFSWHHGDQKPKRHTNNTLLNGKGSLVKTKWIRFHRL